MMLGPGVQKTFRLSRRTLLGYLVTLTSCPEQNQYSNDVLYVIKFYFTFIDLSLNLKRISFYIQTL